MFKQNDVPNILLNKRDIPESIVTEGNPEVSGRILSVSDDKCVARVAWKMTPGAVSMAVSDTTTSDVLYVLAGRAEVTPEGGQTEILGPGDWYECPKTNYNLKVTETFHKISVIYNPNGLALQAEPL
jgi:uncharacterized cupin superfamily protein